MISAQFRIQLPEHLWVSELSRQFTRSEFNLLSGFELDGRALELGEVVTEHPGDVVEAMRTHEAITSFELLESEPGRVLTKYETPQTALYGFAESSSLTISFLSKSGAAGTGSTSLGHARTSKSHVPLSRSRLGPTNWNHW